MTLHADSLQPGSSLGKYVIEGLLGEGGAARVYRARHATLGTLHAIKVLTQASRGMRERLMLEGRVQASLQHPNIVRVLDVDTLDGMPCLVMEYIDGPSLAEVLRLKTPTIESTDDLARQILEAVAYAHEQGLVHRDLKPENILLAHRSKRIVPKIADFGLVKVMGDELSRTRTGSTMGTPLYMSPEQVRDAKNVDHRSDIFSLGTILYTLLAGENPFESNDMFEVFQSIVEGRHLPLREVRPQLPERMLRTVEKAMEIEPGDRFVDTHTMLDSWVDDTAPAKVGSWEDEFYTTARQLAGDKSSHDTHTSSGDNAPTAFPEGDAVGTTLAPPENAPELQGTLADGDITREVPRDRAVPALVMGGAALAIGALGLVGLGLFVMLPGDDGLDPVPHVISVEPPRPAVPTPAPPEPVEPTPEPAPAPTTPRPTRPVQPRPTPAPVVTAPAPQPTVPKPAPPPEPEAPRTRFVNANGSVRVVLRGPGGDHLPGDVPPGEYTVIAFFGDSPTNAGKVVVAAGKTVNVDCKAMLRLCNIR
ncbi:MAG: serine/threonine protein kinase [Alphaproteobacteria bacterium]|nr:serine/threonine protein kinase [Alphaproteobacteria bacterium]